MKKVSLKTKGKNTLPFETQGQINRSNSYLVREKKVELEVIPVKHSDWYLQPYTKGRRQGYLPMFYIVCW